MKRALAAVFYRQCSFQFERHGCALTGESPKATGLDGTFHFKSCRSAVAVHCIRLHIVGPRNMRTIDYVHDQCNLHILDVRIKNKRPEMINCYAGFSR